MSASLPPLWSDAQLHPDALALLRDRTRLAGPHVPPDFAAAPPFGFPEAVAAIVGPRTRFDAAAFARAPRLQVIARTGIGYDNVDVPAASAAGICVVNTPDAPTESTAEFAVALMFAVARRLATADRDAKAGVWQHNADLLGFDLAEKTLALVGFGRIARRVAEIARAIRMRVRAFDPFVPAATLAAAGVEPCATLDAALDGAHVVSLHAPLAPETRHLIGAPQLARLARGAVLINAARGPLIDEAAVLAALDRGQLAGAGLDVWDPEPTAPDHPLRKHPRVVATPHLAAYTEEGRRRSHVAAAEHVLAVLRGDLPPTLIDRSMWARRRV